LEVIGRVKRKGLGKEGWKLLGITQLRGLAPNHLGILLLGNQGSNLFKGSLEGKGSLVGY